MSTILKIVDSISTHVGSAGRWLCPVLILVGTFDVIMRYVFNAPTIWGYETSIMLGAAIYALGWGYNHLHNTHVRVDVFYTHFSPRWKSIADSICSIIFFFPLMAILVKTSISWTLKSWAISEVISESYWYPPAAPSRTILAIGICVFTLQGLARFIRDLYFVMRSKGID
jgi:TRAP-type mannitol/chloroaromatic compound transport system permease small subunit